MQHYWIYRRNIPKENISIYVNNSTYVKPIKKTQKKKKKKNIKKPKHVSDIYNDKQEHLKELLKTPDLGNYRKYIEEQKMNGFGLIQKKKYSLYYRI